MRRGQEEAPIELLVAIVVLGFAIVIAYYSYSSSCVDQFDAKMRSELSHFARDIELVYKGAVGTSQVSRIDFSPAGCPGTELDSIRLGPGSASSCTTMIGSNLCTVLGVLEKTKYGLSQRYVEYLAIDPQTAVEILTSTGLVPMCSPDPKTAVCQQESFLAFRPYSIKITKTAPDKIVLEKQGI